MHACMQEIELSSSILNASVYAKGRYSMELLPGSDLVMERESGVLAPCTNSTCTYGRSNAAEAAPVNATSTVRPLA